MQLNEIRKIKARQCKDLLSKENVVAVGVGYKTVGGQRTGDLSIVCSVIQKLPSVALHWQDCIPQEIEGVPTDVIETGEIRALQTPMDRWRPAPGGVSIGHPDVTAGTLGCLVLKGGEPFILSNNHVLANSNLGQIGDAILQPGIYDGGTMDDQIATLEEFVKVLFLFDGLPDCGVAVGVTSMANWLARGLGSRHRLRAYQDLPLEMNLVDAALARPITPDLVIPEILGFGPAPVGQVIGTMGLLIKKSGRTTGITHGEILYVDVTAQVMYGNDIALFTDQLQAGSMCSGGDSGSAVLTEDDKIVGLLFAGSEETTLFNRIENVVDALYLDSPFV